ncbi:uncharacterized protein LOC130677697 [Microplitis mediator]|uniref:uncharacterized protein LOC130677697 n=1 Tax=Microplitis mediator TaxID=375433 RepID=UPI002554DAFA|nr:uncharacterized protein LOC130677697 [Microplitis mediator]
MQEYLPYVIYGCVTILVITTITLIVFLVTSLHKTPEPHNNVSQVLDNTLEKVDEVPKVSGVTPQTLDSIPQALHNTPEPLNNDSQVLDNTLEKVDEVPKVSGVTPQTLDSIPQALHNTPEPLNNDSQVLDNTLEKVDEVPKVSGITPKALDSIPKASHNTPETLDNASKLIDQPVKPQVLSPESKLSAIKDKLRHFFTDNYNLTPDDLNIIDHYTFDLSMPPHTNFLQWKLDPKQFKQLADLGIRILRNLNKDSSDSEMADKYSKITDNILERITSRRIEDLNDAFRSYEDLLATITTMAAMFQLIVNINGNKPKYHQLILDLIKKIPEYTSYPKGTLLSNASNLFNLSTPRLLTNYINATEDFITDSKSNSLKHFHELINNDKSINDISSDIINIDGSAFKYDADKNLHMINYSNFLSNIGTYIYHSDFYAAVYTILDIPGNYYEVVRKLVRIILHPSIKNINPLFDSRCDIDVRATKFDWLDLKGELGCYLIPSIGLGIIKTKDFMFSLRVPMPEISNYCDLDAGGCLLAGIQTREIHFAETGAASGSPGNSSRLGLITHGKTECFKRSDVEGINVNSRGHFIGRLVDKDIMFWKMEYRVEKFEVKELGVVNSSGMEAFYKVTNNQETDDLYFKWRGSDDKVDYSIDVEGFEEDGDHVKMAAKTSGRFTWKMKVGNKEPLNLAKDWDVMKFEDGMKIYKVQKLESQKQFKVECNDKIILIGGSSTKVDDVINYNGDNYRRDNKTMMYIKE